MLGKVYWITGLSSAGKTTIGSALYYELKESGENVVILDGDIIKEIVGKEIGYSENERKMRAFKYSLMCNMLAKQGITVVCCTISMFDEVRQWNREHMDGYIEVFLDVPNRILKSRDKKNVYKMDEASGEFYLEGMSHEVEFPKSPDIHIINDGSLSVKACIEKIREFTRDTGHAQINDVNYWNNFYTNAAHLNGPSPFAVDIANHLESGKKIIDLGCGNGRDSLFFNQKGLLVTAVDTSPIALSTLKMSDPEEAITCVCDDFANAQILYQQRYDYFYSRFSIHAISEKQQNEMLSNIYDAMCDDGKLFIEVRSTKDDIYGKGEQVGKNTFVYENHHRRFVDFEELKETLVSMGYQLEYAVESNGFAVFKDSDPVVIRIIASK